MFNIFKKFPKHRRIFKAVIFVMIVAVFFIDAKNVIAADTILGGIGYFAAGSVGGAVAIVLGLIALVLTAVIGGLITVVVAVLVQVAQFGNIINVPTVIEGWVIIRDLCNMLFILILLVIAFATILRVESYPWKKLLPKLLIMAILINFSRTIFGLLIDFSQVIMLTFVNSFSQYGAANFISVFNTNFLLSIQGGWTSKEYAITSWSTSVAIIAGVLAAIITLIVVSIMLAVLVVRIIMLWIYTIFSPLIFLGFAVPGIQKYTGRIWEDFIKQLVVGPVLAFFIWLALTTAKTSTVDLLAGKASTEGVEICAGIGAFFCQGNFQQFIIVIGLLMGGLMITQQVGGAVGSIAGKGLDWSKKVGGAPLALGKYAGKHAFFKAGRMADTAQMWGQGKIAKGISRVTGGYFGEKYQAKSLNYRMIKEGWEKNQASKMRDYEGTKAGAWRDQFNRTLSASIGIPIVSQIMRKKSEKKVRGYEEDKQKEEEDKQKEQEKLKTAAPDDQAGIIASIKVREDKIKNLDSKIRSETKKSQQTWTLGKIPIQKYARLQEQEKANEEYTNIKKEDLDERGLVHNYDTEGRIDKKRAYLMHLADINGINTLFDAKGIEMTAKNISEFFEDFGEAAGDVAAEVSRRAEAVGNYKMMGFHKFDVTQGKNTLASIDEQKVYSMKKDNERYAQAHARTTHFDSLVDRTEAGPRLSEIGVQQLLHIASSTGRMKEIKNGNYQTRYGEMVIKIEADITNKANEFETAGREADAAGLRKVLLAFKENYDILGKKEKEKFDEEDKSGSSD